MVIVAFDYGEKNIGIAYSPDGVFSFAVCSVSNRGANKTIHELVSIIKDKGAELVVFGYPAMGSEEETESARNARDFAEALERASGVSVELVDESYTSVETREVGHRLGKTDRGMRDSKDAIEAQLILMRYLEA